MDFASIGKLLIWGAIGLFLVGVTFVLLGRFGVGRLPGDMVFQRGNLTVYVPIGLMILLSVVGTLVLNFLIRR